MEKIKKDAEERMTKAIGALEREFQGLRSGRASTALVENIKVDYYGVVTPVNQIGSVAVPDSRTITIQPWDKKAFGLIEKAILAANLGLTPMNDGKVIRISIPPLTEERRKEMAKVARKYTEDGKVAIRNIRRDANESIKKLEKEKIISEDEVKRGQEEVQKITDSYVAKIDKVLEAKEKEIMEI